MRISDWSSDVCSSDLRPSFLIRRVGDPQVAVRFAGIPLGHEFTSLVLALLQVGGHPPKTAPEVLDQVRALDGDYHFETYFSLSCQNCPDIVQALNLMSVVNPRITHTAIDGGLFQAEVEARRSEEHTSELQSLMRISYAVFCL